MSSAAVSSHRFFNVGPLANILRMYWIGLIMLCGSRAMLIALFHERVAEASSLYSILLQGIRADLILLSLLAVPPVLLSVLLTAPRCSHLWYSLTRSWAIIALAMIAFLELCTPLFALQYDTRPNRLFFEYLQYPHEVMSMLLHGYMLEVCAITATTGLVSFGIFKLFSQASIQTSSYTLPQRLVIWPLCVFLVFAGIRSTWDHRPANPSMFAITSDSLVNSLIINSGYSLLYALYNLRHESSSSAIYGTISEQEMVKVTRQWPWLKSYQYNNPEQPTEHFQSAVMQRSTKPNIVIILQESLGATFVESLGGKPVTPELEKLKSQGIWFDNLYATGTRSARGIEAVVAGFMPTPAQSTVKLSASQRNFTTLASVLSAQGYHTQFIYGGEAHFDSMRSFFTGNGFQEIVDLPQIESPIFEGSWGASDEDLFRTAHQQFLHLSQQNNPFFSLVFTSSNHEPFEFPDGRIELFEQPKQTANNAVKYADWAMGQFFRHAQQSDYWQNTLFLIVADHDNRVYGSNLIPVEKFRIPGLIVGGMVEPNIITPVASQIDLAPTLLSMAGISACNVFDGRDFLLDDKSPGRALVQFGELFALMQEQELTILRPQRPALSATFDDNTQELHINSTEITKEKYNQALAHAQLPSYLYRQRRYQPSSTCAEMSPPKSVN